MDAIVVKDEGEMITKMRDLWTAKMPLGNLVLPCLRIGLEGKEVHEYLGALRERMQTLLHEVVVNEKIVQDLQESCDLDEIVRRLCQGKAHRHLKWVGEERRAACLKEVVHATVRERTCDIVDRMVERVLRPGARDALIVALFEQLDEQLQMVSWNLDDNLRDMDVWA